MGFGLALREIVWSPCLNGEFEISKNLLALSRSIPDVIGFGLEGKVKEHSGMSVNPGDR